LQTRQQDKAVHLQVASFACTGPSDRQSGTESMKNVLSPRVTKHSALVHDEWPAIDKAIGGLGFASAPSVNHSKGSRLVETGWHSNDIESDFARLKTWPRARYEMPPQDFV
jgi:hypothetical protein